MEAAMFLLAVLYLFSGNLITGDRQPATIQSPVASQPYTLSSEEDPTPHSIALLYNPEDVKREAGKD